MSTASGALGRDGRLLCVIGRGRPENRELKRFRSAESPFPASFILFLRLQSAVIRLLIKYMHEAEVMLKKCKGLQLVGHRVFQCNCEKSRRETALRYRCL